MHRLLTAIAVAIALPGVAYAQTAPAEAPKMECCQKMKDKCACCEKMAGKKPAGQQAPSADDPHAGHDMTPKPAPAGDHSHH
jgi:hypothetical protein